MREFLEHLGVAGEQSNRFIAASDRPSNAIVDIRDKRRDRPRGHAQGDEARRRNRRGARLGSVVEDRLAVADRNAAAALGQHTAARSADVKHEIVAEMRARAARATRGGAGHVCEAQPGQCAKSCIDENRCIGQRLELGRPNGASVEFPNRVAPIGLGALVGREPEIRRISVGSRGHGPSCVAHCRGLQLLVVTGIGSVQFLTKFHDLSLQVE